MSKTEKPAGESLGTTVYDALCKALREGEFQPGDRLREEDIAQRFQVSRTPVREALGRLQARGLVEIGNRRGLRVRQLQVSDILELYTMREIVEGAAAGLAAAHASPMEIDALRDLNEAFSTSADTRAMARVNRRFHEAIYRMARNRYLDLTLVEVQDAMALLGTTTFTVSDRPELAVDEHRAIIDAIAERDSVKAEALGRTHIRGALRARLRLINDSLDADRRAD